MIQASVTHPVDFIAAVDGLASRGAQALILTIDSITSRGLPAVVSTASENLMPVYYPSLGGISSDAMISAGYYQQQTQGINTGRKLVAWLRGELDIAATAIEALSGDGVGVNLTWRNRWTWRSRARSWSGQTLSWTRKATRYPTGLEKRWRRCEQLKQDPIGSGGARLSGFAAMHGGHDRRASGSSWTRLRNKRRIPSVWNVAQRAVAGDRPSFIYP